MNDAKNAKQGKRNEENRGEFGVFVAPLRESCLRIRLAYVFERKLCN